MTFLEKLCKKVCGEDADWKTGHKEVAAYLEKVTGLKAKSWPSGELTLMVSRDVFMQFQKPFGGGDNKIEVYMKGKKVDEKKMKSFLKVINSMELV